MSVHDLARAASADLQAHTVADVDAGLDGLYVVHTRHRRRSHIAIALAAAAAVVVGWWGVTGLGGQPSTLEPSRNPSTGSTPLLVPQGTGVCHRSLVTCRGDRTYVFGLTSPVRWQIPRRYGVGSGAGPTSNMVESYTPSGSSGITVMEGVRASTGRSHPAAGVPDTPEGFITWLAARPYLHASAVRRTTLGGLDAWHVRVGLKPHLGPGPGRCTGAVGGQPCYPITYQDGGTTGIWGDMTADYTATDLPGSGTAVVWSWAFGHDRAALHRNQQAVAGLSWGNG